MTTTVPVTSASLQRRSNAQAVLELIWDSADPVTGSDLITLTGLTRTTVHDVCDDLRARGWVLEIDADRSTTGSRKGRPARRYRFHELLGVVVGVDAGQHRIHVWVGDLNGRELARHAAPVGRDDRLEGIGAAIGRALAAAGVGADRVLGVAVGVPAPVDATGHTDGSGTPFWARMNTGIKEHLETLFGAGRVLVDNDANLAALAEGWCGASRTATSYIALLSGERLGAGVVDNGHILRGRAGGAGEMRYLDLVESVGSAKGMTRLAREWAREAAMDGDISRETPLAEHDLTTIDADDVFRAAERGDPVAERIVRQLGERFTRIIATLAIIHDPEVIVITGRIAHACGPVIAHITAGLGGYVDPPHPRIAASELGDDVVSIGAVKRALDHVRRNALDLDPTTAPPRRE
ncbi:MAG TPA: ROK family protein [Microlunatus sp.]|nr:ROK family protein [Microlunatus sp.]